MWDDRTRHDTGPMGWIRGEAGTLLNHLRWCERQPESVQARAEAECLNREDKRQQIGPPTITIPVIQDGTTIVPRLCATQGVQPHGNTSLPLPFVDQQMILPGPVPCLVSVGDGLCFSLPPSLSLPCAPRPLHVSFPTMNPPFGGDPPEPIQLEMTTLSSIPFIRSPSIPRPLHVPFCSMTPEYFQISDTTSSELELSLCVFPLLGCSNGN